MEAKLARSAMMKINNSLRPYPSLFFMPGLRSQHIWEKEKFKDIEILEKNYEMIREEYLTAIETHPERLENDYKATDQEKFLHKGDWEWFSYIAKGSVKPSFSENFPKTSKVLHSLDSLMYNLPFSYTFFSRLAPGSTIAPHYGPCNIRLRIHLGIDVPQGCSLRVAETLRNWEDGKCLVFDDTYLHEVSNKSDKFRTILLLDMWHPDLRAEERQAIVDMFGKAYQKGWLKK